MKLAQAAAEAAYAPYSGYRVGAALRAGGRVFGGCNVENASYGLTMCAERVAAGQAVAAGERRFEALALWVPQGAPALPCGACLQVLAEFTDGDLPIRAACAGGAVIDTTLRALLTNPFSLGQGTDACPTETGG